MRKILFFSALCLILSSFAILNRNNFTDLVQEKLLNYSETEWPEKVYIQTDKSYYSVDESIWFSAYLVNGLTHTQSTKSAVMYVEIINSKDSILDKKKLFINKISAAGDFKIEKNWKEGTYLLRAYTNYMRNNDPDYFFQKKITIWNLNKKENVLNLTNKDSLQEITIAEKPDLDFYPEGGYLVENLSSKVAIKIKNDIYNKINLSGNIIDDDNNIVSQFSTVDFGLGLFSLSPEPNKTYYAILEVNGAEYKYPLPKALPLGYTIIAVNKGDHLLIVANSTTNKGLTGAYLLIHQRGKMLFNKLLNEDKKTYSLKLPTSALRDGVTHLTLFNTDGNPVCERLVFVENPKNKTIINIKKDQEILGIREKISFHINVADSEGMELPSTLSMTVRDANTLPYNKSSENIKTWLLLNSDLRGKIKDPGYFFATDANLKSRYLLDLVMMTHGWRRFTWQSLLYQDKHSSKFPFEKGITISGTTKFLKSPYTATPAATRLTFMGKEISQLPIKKSDTHGKFNYGPFIFFDSIQTLVESRLTDFKSTVDTDRNVLILIDQNDDSPKVKRNSTLESNIETEGQIANFFKMAKYTKEANFKYEQKSQKLDEITIVAQKKVEIDKRTQEMDDRTNYGFPSNRLDVESDNSLNNLTVFDLLSRFPGVTAFNNTISIRGGGIPRIFLDDFEIDIEFLTTLFAQEVSFIDVLKGADAAIFSNAGNGVIAIYSKTGRSSFARNIKRKPGIIDFATEGFYISREFYSPDHINGFDEANKADTRTTLHWEPLIRISNQQKTKDISFFTSDIKSDYIIEIEGISDSGIPLHQTSTFSVR